MPRMNSLFKLNSININISTGPLNHNIIEVIKQKINSNVSKLLTGRGVGNYYLLKLFSSYPLIMPISVVMATEKAELIK